MSVLLPSDLKMARARLLEMFTDLTCTPEIMKNATDAYFSLLQGETRDRLDCLVSNICIQESTKLM